MKKTQSLFLIFFGLILLNSCISDPEAIFSVDSTEYETDYEIEFNNESLNATTYEWDFGDGYFSTQVNPVHSYTYTGNYKVSLNVVNGDKESETTKTLSIVPGFEPTIYEGRSVDGIYVGDSWSEVKNEMGTDTLYTSFDSEGIYYHFVYYADFEVELLFRSYESELKDDDRISDIIVNFRNGGITYKGINFDNTIDDVYTAYGLPLDVRSGSNNVGYWYDDLGIDFYEYENVNGVLSGLVDEMWIYEPIGNEKSASLYSSVAAKKIVRENHRKRFQR